MEIHEARAFAWNMCFNFVRLRKIGISCARKRLTFVLLWMCYSKTSPLNADVEESMEASFARK